MNYKDRIRLTNTVVDFEEREWGYYTEVHITGKPPIAVRFVSRIPGSDRAMATARREFYPVPSHLSASIAPQTRSQAEAYAYDLGPEFIRAVTDAIKEWIARRETEARLR